MDDGAALEEAIHSGAEDYLTKGGDGPGARIRNSRLRDSIVGGHADISNVRGVLLVTDHSVVAGSD